MTPVDVVARIEEMRRAHKWSAPRNAHELAVDGMVISRRTVTHHLAVLGLNRRKFIGPQGTTNECCRRSLLHGPATWCASM
ncbi:hypothetical protein GCM10010521_64230 [Streptomyces rameus]|uniref:Transposase n=1 Tax=Streptomyces rameus TaxID=68261 RepID=A0ABN3V367_9ACTN